VAVRVAWYFDDIHSLVKQSTQGDAIRVSVIQTKEREYAGPRFAAERSIS
jgi:hypothetical protein